jgi:hypothetical protein
VLAQSVTKDALSWSEDNKKSWYHDKLRMTELVAAFGDRAAELITPGDIRRWLDTKASEWTLSTRNRYTALLKIVYRVAEEERIHTNPD